MYNLYNKNQEKGKEEFCKCPFPNQMLLVSWCQGGLMEAELGYSADWTIPELQEESIDILGYVKSQDTKHHTLCCHFLNICPYHEQFVQLILS